MRQRYSWLWVIVLMQASFPVMAERGSLDEIMLGLSEEMTRIGDGIWREEFSVIALAAEAIAGHPLPPLMQRLKLLSDLGSNSSQFIAADKALKAAALEVVAAAKQEDLSAVLNRYQVVQQRCVDCHNWYRNSIQSHN